MHAQHWFVTFLQKCCYKWQPQECPGLEVANLVIFIFKNGEKIPQNNKKMCVRVRVVMCFSFLFHFLKKIREVAKIRPK